MMPLSPAPLAGLGLAYLGSIKSQTLSRVSSRLLEKINTLPATEQLPTNKKKTPTGEPAGAFLAGLVVRLRHQLEHLKRRT
jgi:hypothetical protein